MRVPNVKSKFKVLGETFSMITQEGASLGYESLERGGFFSSLSFLFLLFSSLSFFSPLFPLIFTCFFSFLFVLFSFAFQEDFLIPAFLVAFNSEILAKILKIHSILTLWDKSLAFIWSFVVCLNFQVGLLFLQEDRDSQRCTNE